MRSPVVACVAANTITYFMRFDASREIRIDLPCHQDHFAGSLLFRFGIAREIALNMACRTSHTQGCAKQTHCGANLFRL